MENTLNENNPQSIVTVSELNRTARTLLERGIARLWVEGEISNLAKPPSGHLYFSLKDDFAQISCVYFRQKQRQSDITIENGMQMLAYGKVSLYEPRGSFQFKVEELEMAGEGLLKRRFEALKQKLQAEGLFAEERKKALPTLPKRIGVITSPSGAAIRDILTVLKRRFPSIPVIIYPSSVQGESAAPELVKAINTADLRAECDVLIVGRGGGSLEDLWAFNEEMVARAIVDCSIPVISAVGHEIDFTISDLVADLRAPTPSGAAEIVAPDRKQWEENFESISNRINILINQLLETHHQSLDWLAGRLSQSSPKNIINLQHEKFSHLKNNLISAMNQRCLFYKYSIEKLDQQLLEGSPAHYIQRNLLSFENIWHQLKATGKNNLINKSNRLNLSVRALNAVSPLKTLDRGYAIVKHKLTGKILSNATSIQIGEEIEATLSRGKITATINSRNKKSKDSQ